MLSFAGIIVFISVIFTRGYGKAGKQPSAGHVNIIKRTQKVEESQTHAEESLYF